MNVIVYFYLYALVFFQVVNNVIIWDYVWLFIGKNITLLLSLHTAIF